MVDLEKMLPKAKMNQKIEEETEKLDQEIKTLEENELEYKKLPQTLAEEGWILDKNELLIPYTYRPEWWFDSQNENRDNEFFYSIVKEDEKKYVISWKSRKPDEDRIYAISSLFQTQKFINVVDAKRSQSLGNKSCAGMLPRDKGEIKNFWESLILPINENNIESLLDHNYYVFKEKGEKEVTNRYEFETFEDYPKSAQTAAKVIIKQGNFFTELLKTINLKHEGDRETAILLLLSIGSIFIGEPVHQLLNNEKGAGKTNIFLNSRELIPDQYVMDLRNFSNKFLYYNAENLNPYYNILFFDDLPLNYEKIELLKEIADNNQLKKVLKTLIDQKVVEFELPGLYLSLINRAKSEIDPELGDRHYINSLDNDQAHEVKVKNKIMQNTLRNQDWHLEKRRFALKACYQKLIDNKTKIFNPYLILFDAMEHGNRNITHYAGFIKANTFYNQEQREKIESITIGSFEDMESVINIISESFKIQKYKLDNDERKIIEHLKTKPHQNTYKGIAKGVSISSSLVKHKINGRDNILGLETKGIIKKEYIDPDDHKKGVLIHLISNDLEGSNLQNSLVTLDTNNNNQEDIPSILKWVIIISFLEWLQIIINNIMVSKIKKVIEKEAITDITDYNSMISLLKRSL